ncbi:MAG: hypothetical protein QG608_2905 [Actinomycetota bacterium]|nr:hypothetical protein [Actinomycetota bacterium]
MRSLLPTRSPSISLCPRRAPRAVLALALAAACVGGTAAPALAADAVTITLRGTSATADSTSGVSISGGTVTITAPGTYRFTGTLTDGRVLVNSAGSGEVALVLDGAKIINNSGSAVRITKASSVSLTLPEGTSNALSDAYVYPADTPEAAFHTVASLTVGGAGSLTIRGNAADGLVSTAGLTIASANITVTAADDAIRAKTSLTVSSGTITATSAGGDGLKTTDKSSTSSGRMSIGGGTLKINVEKRCLQAATSLSITAGTLDLSCGGKALDAKATLTLSGGTTTVSRSSEGAESTEITIKGGSLSVTSIDDALNATDGSTPPDQVSTTARLAISGGTVVLDAGGDALDSNGSTEITGGTVVVNGPTVTTSSAVAVKGTFIDVAGTLLAVDATSAIPAPGQGSQGHLNLSLSSSRPAGTTVQIVDSSDTVVAAYQAPKAFRSLLHASKQIVPGQEYRVYTGGTVSGTSIGGLYEGGSTSGATLAKTVTAAGGPTP